MSWYKIDEIVNWVGKVHQFIGHDCLGHDDQYLDPYPVHYSALSDAFGQTCPQFLSSCQLLLQIGPHFFHPKSLYQLTSEANFLIISSDQKFSGHDPAL